MAKRAKRPSSAVVAGGAAGTPVGSLIEIMAASFGHPLPPGAGSAITGVIGMVAAYFAPGGRHGEAP